MWREAPIVAWPLYDRTVHDPIEDAVMVSAPIVLVEGNWLLLDEEPSLGLSRLCDCTVSLRADEAVLRERAIGRKVRGGASRAEAEAHYERSDGPNIRRVLEASRPADLTMELLPDGSVAWA